MKTLFMKIFCLASLFAGRCSSDDFVCCDLTLFSKKRDLRLGSKDLILEKRAVVKSKQSNLESLVCKSWVLILKEIKDRYGIDLTVGDSLQLVENYLLQTLTDQNDFVLTKKVIQIIRQGDVFSNVLQSPRCVKEDSKLAQRNRSQNLMLTLTAFEGSQSHVDELPAEMYIGGVEVLGGALVSVLGLCNPYAFAVGGGLVTDGIRRVFDGISQMNQNDCDLDGFTGKSRGFLYEDDR